MHLGEYACLIMFLSFYYIVMKLTNKQMALVVDMIFDKVKPSVVSQQEKEAVKLRAEAMKKIKASTLFKQIEKVFQACPLINEARIKEMELHTVYPWMSEWSRHVTFTSLNDFVRTICDRYYTKYKTIDHTDKRVIENKVIMASINAKDLESLINSISKEFIK